jgi:hypothetical protein
MYDRGALGGEDGGNGVAVVEAEVAVAGEVTLLLVLPVATNGCAPWKR